ncbi:MAG TPA: hypothetical protein DDW90_05040 [Cyanobacteria bacterium UBA9971]|nr:hypothetical protein [Cyanobacteria bacterium UBA9971]
MFVSFFNNQFQNNSKLSFQGKDGSIKYIGNTVVKSFHSERQQEFTTERDFLTFLTNAKFPNSPKFIKTEGNSITMEKISGQNLLDFLPAATKEQILWTKEQILKVAKNLAKLGVFHNDLNRANIIIVKDTNNIPYKVVFLDFADAKKVKSLDTTQLADDMMYKKHLTPILDVFLSKAK